MERLEETMAKLIENNDALQVISKTDQLTGLLNRWGFLEMVNRYMETASEGTRGLFVFCTIDNDKDVDVFQALATADRLLYQEKRAKKLRRMAE